MKGLFKSLAASQEIQSLDPKTEEGQMRIIRAYLSATNWGTPEEIEDEVYNLQDTGRLEKQANQFKPKLNAMQEQIVNQKIIEREQYTKQIQEEAKIFQSNVYKALEKGELNGLKINNKIQNMLYIGLVEPVLSRDGSTYINGLGKLLEKYRFNEPRYDLMAEAFWLLSDPDGYREELRNQGANEKTVETMRKLKIEQQNITGGSSPKEYGNDDNSLKRGRSIPKPKRNFFER
jgi:hypothetical protein